MAVRRNMIGAVTFALLAALVVVAPTSGSAAPRGTRGHCIGSTGPMCHFWMAKVDEVADGDTIMVYLRGDASHHRYTVRFTGINAMEMHRYSKYPSRWRGECGAIAATRYVRDMIKRAHGTVRLAAQNPASRSGVRLRRQVSVRVGGRWVDLNGAEVAAGQALWMAGDSEWAWNKSYGQKAALAAARRKGLYSTRTCGAGPSASAALRMYVRWDADGNDGTNVNGEWIRVRNLSASAVPLSHWWLRDSSYIGHWAHGFTFPAGTTIPAHGEITLRSGKGSSTATTFHWGLTHPVFGNEGTAPHWIGDGAYLFDPKGNLRSWSTYPCFYSCRDPLTGVLTVTANHTTKPYYATVTNTATTTADVEGVMLTVDGHEYSFAHGTTLAAGASLRVRLGGSSAYNTSSLRYWGPTSPSGFWGGSVGLHNYQGTLVACDRWGSSRC